MAALRRCWLSCLLLSLLLQVHPQHIGLGPKPPFLTDSQLQNRRRTADSLQHLLQTSKSDTSRVNTLLLLAQAFRFLNRDTALLYNRRALSLSQQLNYIKGIFQARYVLTTDLRLSGNYAAALQLSMENLTLAEQFKDTLRIYMTLLDLCGLHLDMGDFKGELQYARKVQELSKHGYLTKNPPADLPPPMLAYTVNFGLAYEGLNQLDSALHHFNRYYSLARTGNFRKLSLTIACGNLANLLLKMNRYDEAFSYYDSTIKHAAANGPSSWIFNAYLGKAKILHQQHQVDSALFYAQLALGGFREYQLPAQELKAAALLNELYMNANRMDSAHRYLTLAANLKDSLFNQEKVKQMQNLRFGAAMEEQRKEQQQRETRQQYENRQTLFLLGSGLFVLFVIAFFLHRNNQQKQRANIQLQSQKKKVEDALMELKATQQQLVQKEKMASLGELTAGIAHEIQNPLNFVNNFAAINNELLAEMKQEIANGNYAEVQVIASDIEKNEEKIAHHGKRADSIVRGMLQHARVNTGEKEPVNINALAEEYLRLSYQGLRAKDKAFDAAVQTRFDESIGDIQAVAGDIGRVLLNLYNNAFYAVAEKKKQLNGTFEPLIRVSTRRAENKVLIVVADNGTGIPQAIADKVFQPFFTTKPTGEGTGLGLSLSYDIVTKGHGGELIVKSKEGEGSEFIIQLPVKQVG